MLESARLAEIGVSGFLAVIRVNVTDGCTGFENIGFSTLVAFAVGVRDEDEAGLLSGTLLV